MENLAVAHVAGYGEILGA